MKATVLRRGALVVDTLPDPVPEKGQVLLRTRACGICGTDLHMLSDGPHMMEQFARAGVSRAVDFGRDIVLGHEFCCEVVDYGPGTEKRFKPGTIVAGFPAGVGLSNTRSGGLGELLVLDAGAVLEVKNGLDPVFAALTEPMAVGLHAVGKARLLNSDLPLVIGCGPVGLAVIAALKAAGIAPIVAADFSPARRMLALIMGANEVVDPALRSPYATWSEVAARSVSPAPSLAAARTTVVFECAGVPGVLQAILEGVPAQARIVMVGACATTDHFEPMVGTLKEVNIQFAVAYSRDEFARTLHMLDEGIIDVSAMVSARVGRDGVANAMRDLATPDAQVKIVVEPWR